MIIDEEDYLAHYGILRRSGRYPWGSGGPEHASNKSFLDYVDVLKKQGMSEQEIARAFDTTVTQLRIAKSIAKNEQRQADISMAQRLRDRGNSNMAISRRMGIPESTVRTLLAPGAKDKHDILDATTKVLKQHVDEKRYVDVGAGVEHYLGVSQQKLATAIGKLKEEGYVLHYPKRPQLGTVHDTTVKVLCQPDVTFAEVMKNRDKIGHITEYSEDGGRTYLGIYDPLSISSKRIAVRYKEDGGATADGVIYIRPGVKDVEIGANRYAQVRVAVDGTHYLKGMAMYKDDLPPGVDIMFNTNKSNTGNKLDAMKAIKDDPENPFGSVIRQITAVDVHGQRHVTSAMNIVGSPHKEGSGVEGSWGEWSKNLSSQFLSKQTPKLAKQQLDMTYESHKNQLDAIMQLTNPAVRRKLLEDLAENIDASAVHLKAAHLPRQSTHVILPINTLKETEIYAPNFNNGERVVLVRHPHGGIFEIPELVVNNNHPEGKKLLGSSKDAVGINHKVAERLSGADFDGDTVLVIPNNNRQVRHSPPLAGLKNFDPKDIYKPYDGMKTVDGGVWSAAENKVIYHGKKTSGMQKQMGDVSNLITDMTIKKASSAELARAVRHSMVVIDSEKHSLNIKQSAIDNGIRQLKEKYQGGPRAGASTLISRKKREIPVPERKQGFRIDPATGKKIYRETGNTYVDRKTGQLIKKTTKVKELAEIDDAHKLSSGTLMENVYANHSNRLKALANQARKEAVNTKGMTRSASAREAYAAEVQSLTAKLRLAERNAPLERQAQAVANAQLDARRRANPDMDKAEEKKIKNQLIAEARTRTGAAKQRIDITESEWHAIQAGAISNHHLTEILRHADMDKVKQYAMPKTQKLMTSTKIARAKTMLANGYTQADVAAQLGVSLTTLKTSLSGGG